MILWKYKIEIIIRYLKTWTQIQVIFYYPILHLQTYINSFWETSVICSFSHTIFTRLRWLTIDFSTPFSLPPIHSFRNSVIKMAKRSESQPHTIKFTYCLIQALHLPLHFTSVTIHFPISLHFRSDFFPSALTAECSHFYDFHVAHLSFTAFTTHCVMYTSLGRTLNTQQNLFWPNKRKKLNSDPNPLTISPCFSTQKSYISAVLLLCI